MSIEGATEPKVGPTRVRRSLLVGCAVMLAACTVWAFWPLPRREAPRIDAPDAMDGHAGAALASLDVEVFRTPIWVAEAPPPPPQEPAPVPPMKLRLVAIVRAERQEDGPESYEAILFDPESNRLITAAAGESIASYLVDAIDRECVTLSGPAGVSTLALNTPERPAGGRR